MRRSIELILWGIHVVGGFQASILKFPTSRHQSVLPSLKAALAAPSETSNNTTTSTWFPTRIQETLPYREIVQRLYLRHIVSETKGMADWIVQQTYNLSTGIDEDLSDKFAELARNLSVCQYTREEGGKIGWVEANEDYQILPADVIDQLYERQPKPGDIVVIPSSSTGQWHCIQVMEAWMNPLVEGAYEGRRVGEHQGVNSLVRRPKLKGAGVLPTMPSKMKTYSIQTAGCQMNVADSERLAGVLQDQLKMTPASKPSEADLVLLNTCR